MDRRWMYGLTRAITTVLAAAAAGFLLWSATRFTNDDVGDYWTRIGLLAGAGLVMGLSQLPGGGTRQGSLRLSIPVLVLAFVPVAVVSLWVILAGEPGAGWFHNHVRSWTLDVHVGRLVAVMFHYVSVLAFGTGLVLGCSFDTDAPQTTVRETTVAEPEVDMTAAQTVEQSEGVPIHERIGAYTSAQGQERLGHERRSGRDRRSSRERRLTPPERFYPYSERRVARERRSGVDRRQPGAPSAVQ